MLTSAKIEKNDGKTLERAVSLIQKTLLKFDPKLKGGDFTVELNKRLGTTGTRYEVDVYVVTHPGTNYSSVVLFECKDWKKPVSKNEVMILKEKVDLAGATRGVLVAASITRDAKALLQRGDYQRIEYRKCSHNGIIGFDLKLRHVVYDPLAIRAFVTARSSTATLPEDPLKQEIQWHGKTATLETLIRNRVDQLTGRDQAENGRMFQEESEHCRELQEEMIFSPAEFLLSGVDIESLKIEAKFFVSVTRNWPKYRCSVDGDGHLLAFEVSDPERDDWKIEMSVVLIENSKNRPS